MPDVSCTVNTCKYWENGNACKADTIIIQSDLSGGVSPNTQLSQLDQTPASSKDETCCQTFKNMR
jgi:hypothetical protein